MYFTPPGWHQREFFFGASFATGGAEGAATMNGASWSVGIIVPVFRPRYLSGEVSGDRLFPPCMKTSNGAGFERSSPFGTK